MADKQHIILQLESNKSTQKEDLADKNYNTDEFYAPSDIVDIDGDIHGIPNENDKYDDRRSVAAPSIGADDGLLGKDENEITINNHSTNVPSRWPISQFADYSSSGFVNINGVNTPIPDINAYQHKKTLAQGMMDLALLSANANQLRYVIESYKRHPYYYPSIIFLSLSIIFQVAVGVGLILNSKYNVRNEREICRANKINNYTVIGIFIVTVVNVFISAFGVADQQP